MTVLIDTSAWIEYLRGTSGASDDGVYAKLDRLVNGLPTLDVDTGVDFRCAATIDRTEVVHRDGDFDVIAGFTGLTARSLR